jgi:glucokinase
MILAGDIGGTKTLLGLFADATTLKHPVRQQSFPSKSYARLEDIVAEFLAMGDEQPEVASFAVAGPVVGDTARITNLPWIINAANVGAAAGIDAVHLMNDVQATAAAVPALDAEDVVTLRAGTPVEHGAIAVIAPGTGLGESFLVWDGQQYRAHATEGGHASFAPGSDIEVRLLDFLFPIFGHLSYERVASGSGIPNLYRFLRDGEGLPEPEWLRLALQDARDPNPVIMQAALAAKADICVATLDLFAHILAGEVGNMALKMLATGGVYLGGGIPPRILQRLQQPDFLVSVSRKGRFQTLLDTIPVHVIVDPEVTLHGAAYDGLMALKGRTPLI